MIRPAEGLATLAALALLAAMTLADWYVPPSTRDPAPSAGETAWQAFGVLDVALAAVAALALALVVLTPVRRSPALPVAAALALVPAALVASLAIAYRLADPPGSLAVAGGAWLGLGCALALLAAAWLSLRDERPHRRGAGPLDVPLRPAPPA